MFDAESDGGCGVCDCDFGGTAVRGDGGGVAGDRPHWARVCDAGAANGSGSGGECGAVYGGELTDSIGAGSH